MSSRAPWSYGLSGLENYVSGVSLTEEELYDKLRREDEERQQAMDEEDEVAIWLTYNS